MFKLEASLRWQGKMWSLRLRAAVFINACAMREAVTLRQGPLLTPENYSKLETANYLFHSALNGDLAYVF